MMPPYINQIFPSLYSNEDNPIPIALTKMIPPSYINQEIPPSYFNQGTHAVINEDNPTLSMNQDNSASIRSPK